MNRLTTTFELRNFLVLTLLVNGIFLANVQAKTCDAENSFSLHEIHLMPEITCPADIIQTAEIDACGAVVTYDDPTFTGIGSLAQTAGLPSGSTFPVGTTLNTFVFTDGAGTTATCTQMVTITDDQAPTITCPEPVTVECDAFPVPVSTLAEFETLVTTAPLCLTSTSLDFGQGGDLGTITGDIVNAATSGANLTAGPVSYNVWDETTGLAGAGGIDDISLSYEIFSSYDVYGSTTVIDPLAGVTQDITQSTSGIRGNIPVNQSGSNNSSTGDVDSYCVTVQFASHICVNADDLTVMLNSVNTPGEVYESSSLVFLDESYTPFGSATYSGYFSIPPTGVDGGVNPPVVTAGSWLTTGTGVYLADDQSNIDISDPFNPFATAGSICNVPTDCQNPNASTDAGLAAGTLVGGFQFCVSLEDIAATNLEGEITSSFTQFTSTLNGIDFGKVTFCGASSPVTDNCGIDATTFTHVGDVSDGMTCPETITRTYSVADDAGNTAMCSYDIAVMDTTPPLVNCPADTVLSSCTIEADILSAYNTWIAGFSFSDGCNAMVTSVAPVLPAFACGAAVNLSYTYEVSDDCGSAMCTSTFEVPAATALSVNCPSDTVLSSCTIEADILSAYNTWIAGFSFNDGCNPMVTSIAPVLPTFACGAAVNLSYTYEVSDDCGSAMCTSTFEVPAATALSVNCPADTVLSSCTIEADILSAYNTWIAGFSFNDGCNPMVTGVAPVLPAFACGAAVNLSYTYEVSDDCGSAMCTSTFEVPAAIALSVDCPADTVLSSCTIEADILSAYNTWIAGFSFSDGCNAMVTSVAPMLPAFGCGAAVNLSYTYVVSDDCGTEMCTSTFEVPAATALSVNCPVDVVLSACTIEADILSAYNTWIAGFGFSDGCNPMVTSVAPVLPAFACEVGLNLSYTYEVLDDCGSAMCSSSFSIEPDSPPIAICQNITVELGPNGEYILDPSLLNNGSTDNCAESDLIFTASQTLFTCSDLGAMALGCANTIPVTLTVTDGCGNFSTCVADVTLEDNLAPVLTCPSDLTITLDPGECEIVLNFTPPFAVDNCETTSASIVTQTSGPALASGDFFPIGSYSYTYEAEDGCGNISTCSYTFVVEEFPTPTTSLACNQAGVQISLDANCEATVGADDILEGGPYGCYDNYEVELFFDANMFMPVPGSPVVNGSHIGQTLYVSINDAFSNNTCWGLITVLDKQIPFLECSAVDVICTAALVPTTGSQVDFPVPTTATVFQTAAQNGTQEYTVEDFDGCGDAILFYQDFIDDVDCLSDPTNPFTKIITRVWTATDEYGNSRTCQDTINLIRVTVADITLPSNYDDQDEPSLSCEEKETVNNGFCGAVVGWNAIDVGEYADDLYVGHPSPSDELYPCGSVKWYGTGIPGGISCGNINYSFTDIRINSCASGSSEGCYKIIRDWTILDWCTGDLATHTQTIKISDNEGPTITDMADVTISTDVWTCAATYLVPQPWIMDNCSDISGNYTVASSMGTVSYLSNLNRYEVSGLIPYNTHQIIIRAEDCCGNATNLTFDVTVEDLVPPTAVCEISFQTSLSIDGTAKIFASTFDDGSHDNCSAVWFKVIRMDDLLGTSEGSNANQVGTLCNTANGDDNTGRFGNQIYYDDYAMYCCEDIGGSVRSVFRVFDVNPGSGPLDPSRMRDGGDLFGHYNDCMVDVQVNDNLPPTIVAPNDVTVSCDFWFDMASLSDNDNTTFGNITVSTFGGQSLAIRDKILVTDRYCDANGPNGLGANEYDPNNPTQTYVKDFGIDGIAIDNCAVVVAINVNDNLECGQGQVTRVFTATDPDGRTASAVQRITILDCDPFFINDTNCFNFDSNDGVDWPCDVDVSSCGAATAPTAANSPRIFNDDNCALIAVSHVDENFPIVANACFKIKRTWTVTDWCNFDPFDSDNNNVYDVTDDGVIPGQWEYVQYLKVLNSTIPVVENITYDNCSYNAYCTGDPTFTVDVSDDCTPGDLLVVDFKLDANNDGVYDAVGSNVTPYPYTNPNGLPVLTVSYSDVDGDGIWTASVNFTDIPLEAEHRILWSAEDACSNVGTEAALFTINDCKLPTPKLVNGLVIETMPSSCMIDVLAMMFDAGSFDNCGVERLLIVSPSLGIGQTAPPAGASIIHTFNENDIGTNTIDIWVEDVNGNYSYATTFLNLQDNTGNCNNTGPMATISGALNDETGQAAEGVEVDLMGTAGMVNSTISSNDGTYSIAAATGQNYSIEPEKLDEVREGISTLDLVLISRHLIGLQPLISPYKLIAADINNDNRIDGFDLIDLQKVILFIYDEFPNNKSFRFVDSDYDFGGNSPFANAFPEHVDINGLTANEVANFMAIKTGDVNGSAQMNSSAPASNRSYRGEFFFNVADRAIVAGETYTVDFTANDYTDLLGYQFAMDFNQSAVDFADVVAGNITTEFGTSLLNEGVLTASYGSTKAQTLENGTVLFTVTLTAKVDGMLSDVLNINRTRYTRAEAYGANLDHMNVNIQFTEGEVSTVAPVNFELLQNQPNPFKDVTEIGFVLPEAGSATITIYDVSGRILSVIEGDYAKGYNKETVTTGDLGVTGVLYYQLDLSADQAGTDDFSATKKMIIID